MPREIDDAALDRFARAWADGVLPAGFVPMSAAQVRARLRELSRTLAGSVLAPEFNAGPAAAAGAALVGLHLTNARVLRTTLEIMDGLPAILEPHELDDHELQRRLSALRGALADGYARALRDLTMADQEQLTQAVLDAQTRVAKELRASEARFRAIFVEAALGIGIADLQGNILRVNQAFADLLGYTPEEMTGLTVADDLMHPEDPPEMWDLYRSMLRGERDHMRIEKAYYRKDGEVVWTDLTVTLLRDDAGAPSFTVAMADDVTERHRLQLELRHQARHDPLTGLPNRTMMAEELAQAFALPDKATCVGLCYLDLDGFKQVNDTLGHDVGDELLAAVAARLDEALSGPGRMLARMGGDEFILLVQPCGGVEELSGLAQAALHALAGPLWAGRHRLRVSASVGVVAREIGQTSPAELLKAADMTLYEAKASGRGRFARFDAARSARAAARFQLAAELPDALERDEFFVIYQPMVDLAEGAVMGVEALLRWRHPRLGVLRPEMFVGLAEESGLIVPIGHWVLTAACAQAAAWHAEFPGCGLVMSVNLAVAQAREPAVADDVAAVLAESGLAAPLLQLELTESAVMDTAGPPLDAMWELTKRGVRIAIDDFGTGYSNLASLRALPVHTLKLAGSFVEGLRDAGRADPVDEQIVDTVIRLAHALGLTVVAEGVETAAQVELLRALSCDIGQGWHFARASDAEGIAEILRDGLSLGR
ncbi:MAG: EAL domain-containing protein [Hamadaea sp.]|nr:EAL domain-containing protein [Hamadaea sp.]